MVQLQSELACKYILYYFHCFFSILKCSEFSIKNISSFRILNANFKEKGRALIGFLFLMPQSRLVWVLTMRPNNAFVKLLKYRFSWSLLVLWYFVWHSWDEVMVLSYKFRHHFFIRVLTLNQRYGAFHKCLTN